MQMYWSVNTYDLDGDIVDTCVLLHIGDTAIIRFNDSKELEDFTKEVVKALPEIRENEAM